MYRHLGFTLIELMIVIVVLAILVSVAYPSYKAQALRGYRAGGQEFLMDIAQREEQYMLDQRQYATILSGNVTGSLNMTMPPEITSYYNPPVFNINNAATPPTFQISLVPIGALTGDGTLIINDQQQHWREIDGDFVYETATDCPWENSTCVPQP